MTALRRNGGAGAVLQTATSSVWQRRNATSSSLRIRTSAISKISRVGASPSLSFPPTTSAAFSPPQATSWPQSPLLVPVNTGIWRSRNARGSHAIGFEGNPDLSHRRSSCGREDDRQAVASEAPVNGEVAAVGGDDFRAAMDFGCHDERGICRIHVLVFHHQLLGPFQMAGPWVNQLDGTHADQAQQGVDGLGVAAQMPTRLTEHNPGGVKRSADGGKGLDRPIRSV
jgi:hypothetical protein